VRVDVPAAVAPLVLSGKEKRAGSRPATGSVVDVMPVMMMAVMRMMRRLREGGICKYEQHRNRDAYGYFGH
jgi:hypothetical protein